MVNFTINVVSEKEDKRVPAALAGQIMVDIQDMFTHIGEYLVAKEMRLQTIVNPKFDEKFRIYMDSSEGVSFGASTNMPETEGRGNLVDEAVELLDKVLDTMGKGTGSYWMEDTFTDALYRNALIYDIVALYQDMVERPGYALMYGTTEELKKFGAVDVKKMSAFIHEKGLTYNGATIGILVRTSAKSARESKFALSTNGNQAKIEFANEEEAKKAEELAGQGAVIIAGTLTYDEDGNLVSITNAGGLSPATEVKYQRMVSVTGDVILKEPVAIKVVFKDGKWKLSNMDLGISVAKDTWDDAIQSFHDYFIFLWMQYAVKGDEGLSEEELEVKRYLLSLIA
ncbi:MAG: hypothetical protein IJT54_07145 [Candidatus Methanomethylophilaceae archaeon]|nr:hypothetical protein [Candidatus Methanomethylophilaceae archaeon]